jgi:hypothetical protein
MAEAQDVHGTVFKNGSATLLARVVGATGVVVNRADVVAVKYGIFLLDERDADSQAAVAEHTNVSLTVADVLFDTLQRDALWTRDTTGYNFKHVLDVSGHQAFTIAGRAYRVVYELAPAGGGQVILVRFRVHAI